MLATVREALPDVPPHTFDIAPMMLQRHARRAPDAFLAVRRHGIWVAAALHAACVLQPHGSFLPRPHLTLEELAAMFDVSAASVSSRSAKLRRG